MMSESYFRIVQIVSENDRETFERFVFEKYCFREQFLHAKDYPDGRVRDEFDPCAAHFLLYLPDCESVYGTFRIVPRTSSSHLPIEKIFSLEEMYLERMCELTRVIAEKKSLFLGGRSGIMKSVIFEAIRQTIFFCKQRNLRGFIGMMDLLAFLKTNDIFLNCLTPIGVPVFYEGGWTMPAVFDISIFFKKLEECPSSELAGHFYTKEILKETVEY